MRLAERAALAISASTVKELARACGFELAGIAPALPAEDFARFEAWRAAGIAGEMHYLTDQRGDLRSDPRNLLPAAKSIVCVGKLYNTGHPRSTDFSEPCTWLDIALRLGRRLSRRAAPEARATR